MMDSIAAAVGVSHSAPFVSTLATTQAAANAGRRTTSTVFWDLVLSATGMAKEEIDGLRENDSPKDVCETPTSDQFGWANSGAVTLLRKDLQEYVENLRMLQEHNQQRKGKKLKLKSFVEDSRYKTAREREASLRVTSKKIAARLERLDLTRMKIESLTEELHDFVNVKELVLSNNFLEVVDFLPPNVQIASFAGNGVRHVEHAALAGANSLVYLGLPLNNISDDLSFLQVAPSLVIVDLSYNEISDIRLAIDVLKGHPTIQEGEFCGNPIALMPQYREILAQATPLEVLDRTKLTEEERQALTTEASFDRALKELPNFTLVLESIDGALGLVSRSPGDTEPATAQGKGAGKGKAAEKKGKAAKGAEESHATGPPAVKKTVVVLRGSWLGQDIFFEGDLAQPPPAPEFETKGKDLKGKKAQDLGPQVSDKFQLKLRTTFDVLLNPDLPVTSVLAIPQSLALIVVDTMEDNTTQESSCGTFSLDAHSLTTPRAQLASSAHFHVDKVFVAERQLAIHHLKNELEKLTVVDRELDKQFLESPTPTDSAAATPQPTKKGAKATSANKQVDEELGRKQAESAARKVEIEEKTLVIQAAELNLQRFTQLQASLNYVAIMNAPPIVETPRASARSEADEKKDPKKKKK